MVTAERIPRTAIARAAAAWHLLVGAALTARPAEIARAVSGPGEIPAPGVTRVLGARSLLQGAVIAAAPTRRVLLGGAGVDITHALSLLPLIAGARYRRAAGVSVAIAAANAAIELAAVRTAR